MARDITDALSVIDKRRQQAGRGAKSEARKWMEVHEAALRQKIETGNMSWEGLADWMWEKGFRTAQGNRVRGCILSATWARINAANRMRAYNYKEKGVTGAGALIGRSVPTTPFQLKPLGKDKNK